MKGMSYFMKKEISLNNIIFTTLFLSFLVIVIGTTAGGNNLMLSGPFTTNTLGAKNNSYTVLLDDGSRSWSDNGSSIQDVSSVEFTLGSVIVSPGGTVDVPLQVNTCGVEIFAVDVTIIYNHNLVRAISVEKSSFADNFTLAYNTSTPGQIKIALAGASAISGDGDLLNLIFEALQLTGETELIISKALVNEVEAVQIINGRLQIVYFYEINVSTAPPEGGSVTGGGSYAHDASVTVTATPATDYDFVSWTEGGEAVSHDAEYTFIVTADLNLVANFVRQTGTLAVTIAPADAISDGAQWSADGGLTWLDSEAMLTLVTGVYTIIYKDIGGWNKPANIVEITINKGDMISLSGIYTRQIKYGDVNDDGAIDVGDAILVLRHIVGLNILQPRQLAAAKVSGGQDQVDVGDAILILRHIVGLITEFPVEQEL